MSRFVLTDSQTLLAKGRLTLWPMLGHPPGSAAARVGIVCITERGNRHGQLPPLRDDNQAVVHKPDGHSEYDLGEGTGREVLKPSVNERLKDVLNKPREKLKIEGERDQEKDQEVEKDRDIDRDPGLSH